MGLDLRSTASRSPYRLKHQCARRRDRASCGCATASHDRVTSPTLLTARDIGRRILRDGLKTECQQHFKIHAIRRFTYLSRPLHLNPIKCVYQSHSTDAPEDRATLGIPGVLKQRCGGWSICCQCPRVLLWKADRSAVAPNASEGDSALVEDGSEFFSCQQSYISSLPNVSVNACRARWSCDLIRVLCEESSTRAWH